MILIINKKYIKEIIKITRDIYIYIYIKHWIKNIDIKLYKTIKKYNINQHNKIQKNQKTQYRIQKLEYRNKDLGFRI